MYVAQRFGLSDGYFSGRMRIGPTTKDFSKTVGGLIPGIKKWSYVKKMPRKTLWGTKNEK